MFFCFVTFSRRDCQKVLDGENCSGSMFGKEVWKRFGAVKPHGKDGFFEKQENSVQKLEKDCRMGLFDLNFCMTDHLHDIMHGQNRID